MSKEKIIALEKNLAEQNERLRKIEQDRVTEREVKRALKHERSGIFKTIINFIKVLTALVLIFTGATHDYSWIKKLIE